MRYRIVTEAEWRARLTEDEYARRCANIGRRSKEIKENFIVLLAEGASPTEALSSLGLNHEWLRAVTTEVKFRARVLALIPSRVVTPATSFGVWLLQCDRVRGAVGFIGDIHPRDAIATAQAAQWSEWLRDRKTEEPLDVVVAGAGADLSAAVKRLKPDGLVLGLGVGPQALEGFRIEIVNVPDNRFFRMTR